jgi:surfeit locus 1 family protein
MPARAKGSLRQAAKIVLLLVALASLLSLGTWQVERLHWKEALLADITARRTAPPVPLADIEKIVAAGGDIDYRAVTVTGRFVNNKERHFFATYDGAPGFHVYTPLELADGRFVFVNRGFVPYDNKEPEMRMQGQLTGEQAVTGLARARLAGKPSFVVPDNDIVKNIFYWKDLDAMIASDGLARNKVLPFFIDAGDKPNPKGMPIGGVTLIDLPNNHLQYALTWYGLAATLVAVAGVFMFRRKV